MVIMEKNVHEILFETCCLKRKVDNDFSLYLYVYMWLLYLMNNLMDYNETPSKKSLGVKLQLIPFWWHHSKWMHHKGTFENKNGYNSAMVTNTEPTFVVFLAVNHI